MILVPQSRRDISIDILKGIGCLFMIVAHSSLNFGGYERFKFWGGLAPVFFFSAAAVTASYQAAKYKPRGVLLTYAFLLLLGFSFNRITDPGFLQEVEFDIIQMIVIGSGIIYLLEMYVRPPLWLYLILGFIAYGLKSIIQMLLAGISIAGVTNLLVPPGIFPIFPWLFLFFFGLFAYRVNNYVNLGLAFGFGVMLYVFPLSIENKWDMSSGYFLACSILLFSTFFILRLIPMLQQAHRQGLLTFLGQNSLLFLFVHFPIALYLKEIRIHRTVKLIFQHPYLFWVLVLALTLIMMFVLIWFSKWRLFASLFDHLSVWILLVILVFAVGILISSQGITYYMEIGLGFLIALFYPHLGNLLKQRSS